MITLMRILMIVSIAMYRLCVLMDSPPKLCGAKTKAIHRRQPIESGNSWNGRRRWLSADVARSKPISPLPRGSHPFQRSHEFTDSIGQR
jgi:hypothetical protein